MKKEVDKTYALLELNREIVGVKLTYSKEEFDEYEAKEAMAPIPYCVAVKSATLGHSIKFVEKTSKCSGSTPALGLVETNADFGKVGCLMGLYRDEETSAAVYEKMIFCKPETYGVIVKPLEKFEKNPDVVLIVANTKECMRIVQGYTYNYGMQDHFCLSGNQAVCVEATARPLITDSINVSAFCSGTRFLNNWGTDEMVVGIPYSKFHGTVDGIRKTVNAVDSDERKKSVMKRLEEIGESVEGINFGEAYYMNKDLQK